MFAIEKAGLMNWNALWVESDSLMVVRALTLNVAVPWGVRTRWLNCKALLRNMSFKCSHTHHEGNKVADALAKNGQGFGHFKSQWWDKAPLFILPVLHRDSIGLPYFRMM